jgi:hypothetical protein
MIVMEAIEMEKMARMALEAAVLWKAIGPHAALARVLGQAILAAAAVALEVMRAAGARALAPVQVPVPVPVPVKQKWVGCPAAGWKMG